MLEKRNLPRIADCAKKNIFSANHLPRFCIYSHDKEPPIFAWSHCLPAKGRIMLAKCANPTCSTPLVYLREGKIFMVESPQPKLDGLGPTKPKPANRVEHFWLCGPCSNEMTITYDRQRGVEITRKNLGKASLAGRAAAS
jgi:hypothetical protein